MVQEKLKEIFREVFADDQLEIKMESSPDDIPDWDSLSQVTLVEEAEKAFGIQIPLDDVFKIKTFGDFVQIIENCMK